MFSDIFLEVSTDPDRLKAKSKYHRTPISQSAENPFFWLVSQRLSPKLQPTQMIEISNNRSSGYFELFAKAIEVGALESLVGD